MAVMHLYLSRETATLLDALSEDWGLSRGATIARALRQAAPTVKTQRAPAPAARKPKRAPASANGGKR